MPRISLAAAEAEIARRDPVMRALIKRHVLEAVIKETGPHVFWHAQMPNGDVLGEDVSFFLKTNSIGFKTWLDADVHVGHLADWPIFPVDAMRLHSANLELNEKIMRLQIENESLKNPGAVMEIVQV